MKLRRDVRDWVVCFHAQQCAEKYLKAFLIRHRAAFPKTHDLLDLLDLAKHIDPTLELLRPDLMHLEPYAVEFRYPGEFATREEAKRSIRVVSRVREALRNLLQLR